MQNMRKTETEHLWSKLLSRNDEEIKSTFNALNAHEKRYVIDHLKKMASEDGWHPEQIRSALHARSVLEPENNSHLQDTEE